MEWLWRILVICILFGSIQWLHTHPDSTVAKQLDVFFHEVRDEGAKFPGKFAEYWHHFPGYMHDMLDTSPKPTKHP
jgi:hypothetical protein